MIPGENSIGSIPIAAAALGTNRFVMSASEYIAAGGNTNTTAQLTAPAGKTFQAGKITDDVNPPSGVDLGSNLYTELEFCVQPVSGLVSDGEVYLLRITADGIPFSSYSSLPQWTIGSGVIPWRPTNSRQAGRDIFGDRLGGKF